MYDTLSQELSDYIPIQVQITKPQGGMFLWLSVNTQCKDQIMQKNDISGEKKVNIVAPDELFSMIASYKVIAAPGHEFFLKSLKSNDVIMDQNSENKTEINNDMKQGIICLSYVDEVEPIAVRLSFAYPNVKDVKKGSKLVAIAVRQFINKYYS